MAGRSRRLRCDRGEIASTLLVFLLIITAFMIAVHATFIYHGNNVLTAAAQEALATVQLEGGTQAAAVTAAADITSLFPALAAEEPAISTDDDGIVTVTISGSVDTPFFAIGTNLVATISGPEERFYEENQRR